MSTYNVTTPSTSRDTRRQQGRYIAVCMGASQTFQKGDQVVTAIADGLAYPGISIATSAAGDVFLGVATEAKVSTALATSAAPEYLKVDTEGVHDFDIAATTLDAALGQIVYAENATTSNPQTVTLTAASTLPQVGRVVGLVSTTKVRVKLMGPYTAPS